MSGRLRNAASRAEAASGASACPTPTRSGPRVAPTRSTMTATASASVVARPSSNISAPADAKIGTPAPSGTSSRPLEAARAISPIVNTDCAVRATPSAASVASGARPPSATISAARHTQQPSMNEAVPVSTRATGTSTSAAASRAAPSVADWLAPTWIDRISVAPSSMARR